MADCSIRDLEGLTPLHFAVKHSENSLQIDTAILLVVAGKSDLNSKSCNKCSILHDAARHQTIDIIDYFIKAGANIHCYDVYGNTPKYYSLGRIDQQKIMEFWNNQYLNNDIHEEVSELSNIELSNINHLEAFRSIVYEETHNNRQPINEVINR